MNPQEKLRILTEYALMKIADNDWHGLSDAANDIRELVARNPDIRDLKVDYADVLQSMGWKGPL
jgi:hypothetical protein